MSRDGFYKSLALTGIAQQGKVVDEKSLQQYAENGVDGHVCVCVWGGGGGGEKMFTSLVR